MVSNDKYTKLKKSILDLIDKSDYFHTLQILGKVAYKKDPQVSKIDDKLEELVEEYETKHIVDKSEVSKLIDYISRHQFTS